MFFFRLSAPRLGGQQIGACACLRLLISSRRRLAENNNNKKKKYFIFGWVPSLCAGFGWLARSNYSNPMEACGVTPYEWCWSLVQLGPLIHQATSSIRNAKVVPVRCDVAPLAGKYICMCMYMGVYIYIYIYTYIHTCMSINMSIVPQPVGQGAAAGYQRAGAGGARLGVARSRHVSNMIWYAMIRCTVIWYTILYDIILYRNIMLCCNITTRLQSNILQYNMLWHNIRSRRRGRGRGGARPGPGGLVVVVSS